MHLLVRFHIWARHKVSRCIIRHLILLWKVNFIQYRCQFSESVFTLFFEDFYDLGAGTLIFKASCLRYLSCDHRFHDTVDSTSDSQNCLHGVSFVIKSKNGRVLEYFLLLFDFMLPLSLFSRRLEMEVKCFFAVLKESTGNTGSELEALHDE